MLAGIVSSMKASSESYPSDASIAAISASDGPMCRGMNVSGEGCALVMLKTTHSALDRYIGLNPNKEVPLSTRAEVTRVGVSFGSALAIAISWSVNKSVLWAILHGVLSWFYVVYYVVTR